MMVMVMCSVGNTATIEMVEYINTIYSTKSVIQR